MNTYKFALNALHYSGVARVLKRRYAGLGVLLTLHHVRPRREERAFSPNRILEITPEFLRQVIEELASMGYDFISLDEFSRRMSDGDHRRPFVSFTLDDGYRDNFTDAYPVFSEYGVPFAVYLCTGIMDGTARLWWLELEEIVRRLDAVRVRAEDLDPVWDTSTTSGKHRTFDAIYWALRKMPLEQQLDVMNGLREENGFSADWLRVEPLTWQMVNEMHASGLMTIGAHTVNHHALSKLPLGAMREEIEQSRAEIAEHTGVMARHFAYPYGDRSSASDREFRVARDLGFVTAVTTRKDVILPRHAEQTHGLPRMSLNGDYQRLSYLRVLMTGVPFALHRRLNREEATY